MPTWEDLQDVPLSDKKLPGDDPGGGYTLSPRCWGMEIQEGT